MEGNKHVLSYLDIFIKKINGMDSIYTFHGSSVDLQIHCSLKVKILDHSKFSHVIQCDNKFYLYIFSLETAVRLGLQYS